MVIAVQEMPATDVDHVIGSVLAAYSSQGEVATEMTLAELVSSHRSAGALRAVVADGVRTVEIALDDEAEAGSLAAVVWGLEERGWSVVVLVPLERLGDAHVDLRGAPCSLQGWWRSEAGICFTSAEIP